MQREDDIKNLKLALGHSSSDEIKHLKTRTDVKGNYRCNVCNATKELVTYHIDISRNPIVTFMS